ncbi:hypothetical protein BX596_3794 [Enterobacteriaceae bacterium JKS000233]|nr:hypothetical protein BX596_3794 [Enterobacteriaceae bacterium JKS000233]
MKNLRATTNYHFKSNIRSTTWIALFMFCIGFWLLTTSLLLIK